MKYTGGCHCKAVQYEVEADITSALSCNCSHCHKKGLLLVFVDTSAFTLLSGSENLEEYFFNKKQIRHVFCRTCGVQSFGEGVTFPKVALNVRCLDGVDVDVLVIEKYNGADL